MKTWFRRMADEMAARVERRKVELGVGSLPDFEWRAIEGRILAEGPAVGGEFPEGWAA